MTDKTIHLVFKTHLDIGFSNLAENVRREYHRHFIPQALTTAEHFFGEDPRQPKFIWTTGAWLIADYLAGATADEAARLERAIERGLIRWHALPFTTHSELMSPDLFRAGLSYARELDRNAFLRAARDQSALAARQSAKLYQFGRTDFLSQLDADRTLASAESVLATSDAQLAADQVQLFLALGGGWENTRAAHGSDHDRAHDIPSDSKRIDTSHTVASGSGGG